MKQVPMNRIVDAIHKVLNGDIYFSQPVITRMMKLSCGHPQSKEEDSIRRLSDREMATFQLIGQGYSTQYAAKTLYVSPKTIESYRSRIKEKLGLNTAFELRKTAIEWTKSNQT